MGAGDLRHRVTFSARVVVGDGYGNERGDFAERFTLWAGMTFLRGTEAVMASRLEGRQPVIIRVRRSSNSRQITSDWCAADARTGEIYNIRAIVPTSDRLFLDITAESGRAP